MHKEIDKRLEKPIDYLKSMLVYFARFKQENSRLEEPEKRTQMLLELFEKNDRDGIIRFYHDNRESTEISGTGWHQVLGFLNQYINTIMNQPNKAL